MADTARCCFICGRRSRVLSVLRSRVYRERQRRDPAAAARLRACFDASSARNIPASSASAQRSMFAGSLVAIVTPMRAGWQHRLRRLVAAPRLSCCQRHERHRGWRHHRRIRRRSTEAELRELTRARAARSARQRMALIAGAGTSSTAATVERVRWLSRAARRCAAGRDAGVQPPDAGGAVPAFRSDRRGRRGMPVLLYNVPARTAVDMLPATVARLSRAAAHRRASRRPWPRRRVCASWSPAARPDFKVLSGDDRDRARGHRRRRARGHLRDGERGAARRWPRWWPRRCAAIARGATQIDQRAGGPASRPVPRVQSDPGQMGAGAAWG